jgi:hypothetical protein
MQYAVYEEHAIEFAKAFYANLAAGLSLDEAMAAGRSAMYALTCKKQDQEGFLEWGIPVLYSRLTDGQLFPERMESAGETARQLREVIQQTVDTIAETGEVIGIEGITQNGEYKVSQVAKDVKGRMIGITGNPLSGSIIVNQNLGNVSGTVIGFKG